MGAPGVSVIVATFNEQETIEECLYRIAAVYPSDCEILVVDGGQDATGDITCRVAAQVPTVRYVRNEKDRGKGHAIRVGIAEARADIMAQIDADLQFLPEELPRLVEPLVEGRADVTLGTRFASSSSRRAGSTPFHRTVGNKMASLYASILCGHRMTDVQAGIKAWTRTAMDQIRLTKDNYSYEAEIPIKALSHGFRVLDVPVTTDARQGGKTRVNCVRDGIPLLWDITMFRLGKC